MFHFWICYRYKAKIVGDTQLKISVGLVSVYLYIQAARKNRRWFMKAFIPALLITVVPFVGRGIRYGIAKAAGKTVWEEFISVANAICVFYYAYSINLFLGIYKFIKFYFIYIIKFHFMLLTIKLILYISFLYL